MMHILGEILWKRKSDGEKEGEMKTNKTVHQLRKSGKWAFSFFAYQAFISNQMRRQIIEKKQSNRILS